MTQKASLLTAALAALLLSTAAAPALDSSEAMPLFSPSITGSYLAGRQALDDLRTEDAARYLKDATENDWDNPLVIERGVIAFAANGQIEDSARLAAHLIELNGPTDLASLIVATEALKQRRYGAVARELSAAGGDTFAGITGAVVRAWALTAENKPEEADAILDKIAEGGLEDFVVFHRALMADVAGRSSEALEYAARAYEAEPFVARIVEAYLRILGNAGRFDEATKVLADFDQQGLSHPMIDALRAPIAAKRRPGVFAADAQSGAAEIFHSIGVEMARQGSPEVAAVFLQLGMYLDPASEVIDLMFGQVLDIAGQHEAANRVYDQVVATSPMKPMAVVRIAQNLDALGDRPGAFRELSAIIASNPDDIEALSVLGTLQRIDEKYAEASETYTRALAVADGDVPSDWRFYYERGISYERNKEWPKAEADFKRALELNPDQPQVLNYLGYSWVDQGINLIPALAMIEKAVAASPNDGYIVDSLGWAYYRLGRFDEAVVTLEQAVQMRSNDPELNDHLGDAYWRVGRELEARFQWNIAAAVDEDGVVSERVKPKLASGLEPLVPGPVAETAPNSGTSTSTQ